jgi:succinyl-diaminopimelate desuccinylase
MESRLRQLINQIDPTRLAHLTMELARIPSPTRQTEAIVAWYAGYARDRGLPAEVRRDAPDGATLVISLPSAGVGPTLTLLGHLDHRPLDHPPAYQEGGLIYGRGCAEGKSGVAAITEALRVLASSPYRLRGRLQAVIHTLHEPPGRREGLDALARHGSLGNAVICAAGPHRYVPVAGRGCAQFRWRVRQEGEPMHELYTPADAPHPIWESRIILERLERWNEELGQVAWPYIGPETVQVGSIHAGDEPERMPAECAIAGTRRFSPGKTEHEIVGEFLLLQQELQARTRAKIECQVNVLGLGFRLHEREPIIQALRRAYSLVTDQDLPLGGFLDVGDASKTAGEYGIPTVYHGTNRERYLADLEYVSLRDVVRAARVYLAAAVYYLGFEDAGRQ